MASRYTKNIPLDTIISHSTSLCEREACQKQGSFSELPSGSKLNDSRVSRTGDLAERSAAIGCVYRVEVCVVEDVKKFAAKLENIVTHNVEVFIQPHIEIHQTRSRDSPVALIT